MDDAGMVRRGDVQVKFRATLNFGVLKGWRGIGIATTVLQLNDWTIGDDEQGSINLQVTVVWYPMGLL